MGYRVDNAVIMAAGASSRFAPLSYECHKGLIEVKGEILIERQIRQLQAVGIREIYVVVGYKKEQFSYLEEQFGVRLVENPDYEIRNNNSSIYAVKDCLKNSYICSCDNYFSENPFEAVVDESYYAALYSEGETKEWCMTERADGYIDHVTVGGRDAWYMLGHTFWSEDFSRRFVEILEEIYEGPETADKYWENIYIEHMDELPMKLRKYPENVIFEFDSLDELRSFDPSYVSDTRSSIMKEIARRLGCEERDIIHVSAYKSKGNIASGIRFTVGDISYEYGYDEKMVRRL